MIIRCYLLALLTAASTQLSFSQDTLTIKNSLSDPDTVIIYQEPVIFKKTVYYSEEKEKDSTLHLLFQISASPVFTINRYHPCSSWEFYLDSIKNVTSPSTGYILYTSFVFLKNNLLLEAGLGYSHLREKFTIISSAGTTLNSYNTFNYLSLPIVMGYKIVNKKKLQIIPSAGMILRYTLSVKGNTLTEERAPVVENITSVRKYYSFNYALTARTKIIYLSSDTFHVGLEPFYSLDIRSAIQNMEPFTLYRNNVGLKTSIYFMLK